MSEVILTDANFEQEVLQSAQPVLVDFWAPWCGPCRAMGPVVETLAKEFAGKAKVCKMNVDENPATASKYAISSIPTIIFFKGGQPAGQTTGMQSAAALQAKLNALL